MRLRQLGRLAALVAVAALLPAAVLTAAEPAAPAHPPASAHGSAVSDVLLAVGSQGSVSAFRLIRHRAVPLARMPLGDPAWAVGPGPTPGSALAYVPPRRPAPAAPGGLMSLDFARGGPAAPTIQLQVPRPGTMYTGVELDGGRVAATRGLVAVNGFHGGGLLEVTLVLSGRTFAPVGAVSAAGTLVMDGGRSLSLLVATHDA